MNITNAAIAGAIANLVADQLNRFKLFSVTESDDPAVYPGAQVFEEGSYKGLVIFYMDDGEGWKWMVEFNGQVNGEFFVHTMELNENNLRKAMALALSNVWLIENDRSSPGMITTDPLALVNAYDAKPLTELPFNGELVAKLNPTTGDITDDLENANATAYRVPLYAQVF